MMDFSFLSKAMGILSQATVDTMNDVLDEYAIEEEMISGEKLRLDTTVYEVNIHYPTDSSLLWDGFRTLARLLK
jgi:transposase, IS5 family